MLLPWEKAKPFVGLCLLTCTWWVLWKDGEIQCVSQGDLNLGENNPLFELDVTGTVQQKPLEAKEDDPSEDQASVAVTPPSGSWHPQATFPALSDYVQGWSPSHQLFLFGELEAAMEQGNNIRAYVMGPGVVVDNIPISPPEIITPLAERICTITSAHRLTSS